MVLSIPVTVNLFNDISNDRSKVAMVLDRAYGELVASTMNQFTELRLHTSVHCSAFRDEIAQEGYQ